MVDLMLSGKVAIVTGAGIGIGKAISVILVNEGVKVVIGDLIEKNIKKVAEEVKNLGGEPYPVKVDTSNHSMVKDLFNLAI